MDLEGLPRRVTVAVVVAFLSAGCFERPRLQWTPTFSCAKKEGAKDFDVACSATDPNGSPDNPVWGAQTRADAPLPPTQSDGCVREPYGSNCTTAATTKDRAKFPNVLICSLELKSKVHGHVDWTPASATGRLTWMSLADDWDYNFHFFPKQDSGLTKNNASVMTPQGERRYIELEFDSRETIDNFKTKWWREFADAVRADDGDAIQRHLTDQGPGATSQAVVYGLFGLDCEHECQSEFHPVYALGIETSERDANNSWSIFVRNWGDEGFCSRMNHELALPGGVFSIRLPRTGERPTVDVEHTEFRSTGGLVDFPAVSFDEATKQVVLTFTLPPPEKRVNAELELHLKWPGRTTAMTSPLTVVGESQFRAAEGSEPDDVESYLHMLASTSSREQLSSAGFRSAAESTEAVTTNVPGNLPNYVPARNPPAAPTRRLAVDSRKEQLDRAYIAALCAAHNNKLPLFKGHDVSAMCKQK